VPSSGQEDYLKFGYVARRVLVTPLEIKFAAEPGGGTVAALYPELKLLVTIQERL